MVLNFLKLASLKGLVIALFLMPSYVNASYLWTAGASSTVHISPSSACSDIASTYSYPNFSLSPKYVSDTSYTCVYGEYDSVYGSTDRYNGDCPSPYVDDGSGNCVEETQCPVGTVDIGSGGVQDCAEICTAGTVDTLLVPLGDIPQHIITSYGCSGNFNGTIGNCTLTDNLDAKCYAEFNQTGDFEEDNDCTVTPASMWDSCYSVVGSGGTDIYDSTDNTTGNTSAITDATSNTQIEPSVVETLPDGTVITTDLKIDSSSASDSITISETNPDFIFIQEKDGSTTITQTQTTTTSNPDGSSVVETEKTNSYTSPKTDTTTVDKSTGSASITSSGGQASGSTSIITNNYNPSGELTGSTQEQTGDGSGTDEPCPVDTICAEDGTEYALPEGEGSFDDAMTQAGSDIAQAKTDLLSTFNAIKSEASSLVSFSGSGSGALPCPPPVDLGTFGQFDLCMSDHENQLSIIGTILIFVASFLALAIILR